MQIPGIDDATAEQLIASRSYASNDAILAKLAEVAPNVDQALAASYLATN
ncbi:MAG: hypothetical protein ACK2UF_03525 [Candidatus Promineifilaceae bacterium]|jgi:hypothetical protein